MTKEQIISLLCLVGEEEKIEAVYVNNWGSETKCELTGINFKLENGLIKAVLTTHAVKEEAAKTEEELAA